jgi:hypothetical protein
MLRVRTQYIFLLLPLLLASCSKDSSVVDTASPDLPLSFTNLRLSGYQFDTDSIGVSPNTDKTPEDPITVPVKVSVKGSNGRGVPPPTIESARCEIVADGKDVVIASADLASSDGTFSGTVPLRIRRGDVGDYRLRINGVDSRGLATDEIFAKLSIFFGRKPPVICGISAPDTITAPITGFDILHIEACVQDSSGLADIKRVLFNSYLPNGNPSSRNPYILADDGTLGDLVPGDGIYTIEVQIDSSAMKGIYRFEFQAFDLSNLLSQVRIHTIYVK